MGECGTHVEMQCLLALGGSLAADYGQRRGRFRKSELDI